MTLWIDGGGCNVSKERYDRIIETLVTFALALEKGTQNPPFITVPYVKKRFRAQLCQ
jgi:hypothetical protein